MRDRDGWGDFYDACRDARLTERRHARPAPARHPPSRTGFGALGRARPRRAGARRSCSSSCRPTPTSLLAWIGDAGLRPPVALLGYLVDRRRRGPRSAPLAEFSPEWQAVRWAIAHDVPVRPIDLPAGVGARRRRRRRVATAAAPRRPARRAGRGGRRARRRTLVGRRGRAPRRRRAGVRRRRRGDGRGARRHEHRPSDDARREAHMRRAIRAALADAGQGAVAVVCGAWHVPALDPVRRDGGGRRRSGQGAARRRARSASAGCRGRDRRLEHGHGVRRRRRVSPGWYRHVFRHPGPDGVTRFFVDAAAVLRARGLAVSPDHLIAAARLADAVAALRGRPRAGLDEVLDAAAAVVGGTSGRCRSVIDELTRRRRRSARSRPRRRRCRSSATSRAAQRRGPAQARRSTPRRLELDLRTPNGLRRSHLLHRSTVLGVRLGSRSRRAAARAGRSARRGGSRWDPERVGASGRAAPATAPRVERGGDGDRLVERAAAADAAGERRRARRRWRCSPTCPVRSAGRRPSCSASSPPRAPDVAELIDALGAARPRAALRRRARVPTSSALRDGVRRDGRARARRARRRVPPPRRRRGGGDGRAVERRSRLRSPLLDHPARHARSARGARPRSPTAAPCTAWCGAGPRACCTTAAHWSPDDVSTARSGGRSRPARRPPTGPRFVEGFLAGSGTVLRARRRAARRRRSRGSRR